jgi:predicted DsbA family dithiol-disulfide isomerase
LQVDPVIMTAKFKEMATEQGLPACELKNIYNSSSAQELGFFAESLGKGDEYHESVFRAFYGEGRNISDGKVLADIVESIGMSGKDALTHLKNKTFHSQVADDWKLAKDLELVAAPTYIIDNNRLVGAHPYQRLQKFIESNGAKRRV